MSLRPPPNDLTPAAAEIWTAVQPQLIEQMQMGALDYILFKQLCILATVADRLGRDAQQAPLFIGGPRGITRANPLFDLFDSALHRLMAMTDKFGMNPATRMRLKKAEEKDSELEKFLQETMT